MESILTPQIGAPQIGAPQAGRLDRHVRRSYLRIGEDTSRHRIAYTLEEALRLASLPGEEEGRIYCFRRVSLAGVPAEAMRRIWVEQVQQTLNAMAAQAVHGASPRAGAAEAVYFNNLEEALETLLRNFLRSRNGVRGNRPEWFSSSLLGVAEAAGAGEHIAAIVERLRPPSVAPAAAAAILFAALGGADPAILLSALPSASVRAWVRALEDAQSAAEDLRPLELPEPMKVTLRRAASAFGWKDPAVVWLAAQAVLCIAPGAWSAGTAIKRARLTLRQLETEQRTKAPERTAPVQQEAGARALIFDDEQENAAEPARTQERHEAFAEPHIESAISSTNLPSAEIASLDFTASVQAERAEDAPRIASFDSSEDEADVPAKPPLLGEATQAAGLYFLLNALRRVGIAGALEASPALAEAGLATHVLKGIARLAQVAESDPILLCLHPLEAEFSLSAAALVEISQLPKAWPVGFATSSRSSFDSAYFLRVWVLAVRQWCWRNGRMTVREVVERSGRVWLTRTDLDVTLRLAAADIRIRRIGLDINPGWLPWLGEWGRVVRFHYSDREPERRVC